MNSDPRKFVYTTPRHYRAIYFVEITISSKALINILQHNLEVWGGRYNPIIPIRDGKVDDSYIPLLKGLDPDFVYHSEKVDPDVIKKLQLFNPLRYERMDERGSPTSGGVNQHYLLDESNRDYFPGNEKLPVLHIQGSHQIDLKAKQFYQLNFGLTDLYANEDKFIRGFELLEITKQNYQDINKTIAERRPYFKSLLSQLKVNTFVFRSADYAVSNRFELVVFDPKSPHDDVLYYWNRQQFIEHNRKLSQLLISTDELQLLVEDPYFEYVLMQFQEHNTIHFVSRSIEDAPLEALKNEVQKKFKRIHFVTINRHIFPYEIRDRRYENQLRDERRKHIFGEEKDVLRLTLPKLSERMSVKGSLIYDVEIDFNTPGQSPESHLKLPINYPLYNSRINFRNDQSLFVSSQEIAIDFSIPTNNQIFRRRLLQVRQDKENTDDTGFDSVRFSTHGQKMNALLELFHNNWVDLSQLFEDKFWLDIFRFKTEFPKDSNIPKNRGVFSFKDLINERTLLYNHFRGRLAEAWTRDMPNVDVNEMIKRRVKDDMEDLISYHLQNMVNIGAVFIGSRVECHTCGSNKWYSLTELKDKMPCKGCGKEVIPQIEKPYYYKINDIIINNLLSDATGNGKDFDGNYMVFRALNYLKDNSRLGFIFCCPLDYGIYRRNETRWIGDIDIVAIQDGKFIIGEAKNNATEFSPNVIKKLIELTNKVNPDAVIVAYQLGSFGEDRTKELRAGITNQNCEIIDYKASPPWYHHGGLFGFRWT